MNAINADLASKITARVDVDEQSGCWNWRNALSGNLPFVLLGGKEKTATRVSYAAFIADPPDDHLVTRKCKNLRCVNPQHLELKLRVRAGFCRNGHKTDNKRGPCRQCETDRQARRRQRLLATVGEHTSGKLSIARTKQFLRYGLTEEDFATLLARQDWRCAICEAELEIKHDDPKRWPNIDHCHKTGKVRGVLCQACNKGIGLLTDSPTLCRRAAQYLEEATMPKQCTPGHCTSYAGGRDTTA